MLLFYQVKISLRAKHFIPHFFTAKKTFVSVDYLHHHLLQREYQVNLELMKVTRDLMETEEAKYEESHCEFF